MEWLKEDRNGSTLEAEVRIQIDLNHAAPDFIPGRSQMVFCSLAVWDETLGRFVKSTDFTAPLETTFDIINTDEEVS